VDFGVGAAVLAFPVYPSLFNPPGGWLTIVGQFAALAVGMGACGAVVAWAALPLLRRLSGWSPQNVPDLSRRGLMFAGEAGAKGNAQSRRYLPAELKALVGRGAQNRSIWRVVLLP
jgi:hypothetical protein